MLGEFFVLFLLGWDYAHKAEPVDKIIFEGAVTKSLLYALSSKAVTRNSR